MKGHTPRPQETHHIGKHCLFNKAQTTLFSPQTAHSGIDSGIGSLIKKSVDDVLKRVGTFSITWTLLTTKMLLLAHPY